eukprot:maker-scaffold651_size119386-snap-gene-0.30 protein:Tk06043 transcript:maker-scaffold651_size119386-snap-gene-0.30-mRNA-1 annotation:"hypothetical protein"
MRTGPSLSFRNWPKLLSQLSQIPPGHPPEVRLLRQLAQIQIPSDNPRDVARMLAGHRHDVAGGCLVDCAHRLMSRASEGEPPADTLIHVFSLMARGLAALQTHGSLISVVYTMNQNYSHFLPHLLRLGDPSGHSRGAFPAATLSELESSFRELTATDALVGRIYASPESERTLQSYFEIDVLEQAYPLPTQSQLLQVWGSFYGVAELQDCVRMTSPAARLVQAHPQYCQALNHPQSELVLLDTCPMVVLKVFNSGHLLLVSGPPSSYLDQLEALSLELRRLAFQTLPPTTTRTLGDIGDSVIVDTKVVSFENRLNVGCQYFRGLILAVGKGASHIYLYDLGVVAETEKDELIQFPILPLSLSLSRKKPLCRFARWQGVAPKVNLGLQDHANLVILRYCSQMRGHPFFHHSEFAQILKNLTHSQRPTCMNAAWALHHAFYRYQYRSKYRIENDLLQNTVGDRIVCQKIALHISQGNLNKDALHALFYCLMIMPSKLFQEVWAATNLASILESLAQGHTDSEARKILGKIQNIPREGNLCQKIDTFQELKNQFREEKKMLEEGPRYFAPDPSANRGQRYDGGRRRGASYSNRHPRPSSYQERPGSYQERPRSYQEHPRSYQDRLQPRTMSYRELFPDHDKVDSSARSRDSVPAPLDRAKSLELEHFQASPYTVGRLFKVNQRPNQSEQPICELWDCNRLENINFNQISAQIVAFLNARLRGRIYIGIKLVDLKPLTGDIKGVHLSHGDRDHFRALMDSRMKDIQPKIISDLFKIEILPAKIDDRSGTNFRNMDRYVIRIDVSKDSSEDCVAYEFKGKSYIQKGRSVVEMVKTHR